MKEHLTLRFTNRALRLNGDTGLEEDDGKFMLSPIFVVVLVGKNHDEKRWAHIDLELCQV
jgi:hypothetical protein